MNQFEPYYFYFEQPIYSTIKIDENNQGDFASLLQFTANIDAYNPALKENSTFKVSPSRNNNIDYYWRYGGMNYSKLTCVRTGEEYYFFYYYDIETKIFQKVGQIPRFWRKRPLVPS